MARSMLKAKNMPNRFWGEAIYTDVHIINRCPYVGLRELFVTKPAFFQVFYGS